MKKYMLSLLVLSFTSPILAFDCKTPADIESIAKEAIMMELSGIHISELEGSECLQQAAFPQIRMVYDPSTERSLGAEYLVEKEGLELKLSSELRDKENHVYKVSYSIAKAKKVADGKVETLSDELEFYLYTDLANQSKFGCAAVITPPTKRALFTTCQKVEKKTE